MGLRMRARGSALFSRLWGTGRLWSRAVMIRLVLEKGRVETLVRRLGQGGWREWVGSASWGVAGGLFTFMCFRDVNLPPQGAGT